MLEKELNGVVPNFDLTFALGRAGSIGCNQPNRQRSRP